jgi:glycyl-tRNA synthetase
LCFYSKGTSDIEYKFPFGWGELWGIADRTDYDLSQHANHSGANFEYIDPTDNSRYIPNCVEPSLGVERLTLVTLCEAYDEEVVKEDDTRIVMRLHPAIAPYKACIMPLSKQLNEKAIEVYTNLSKKFMIEYDEAGSIGKRYRRQDAIGTPMCITIDFDTANDDSVTVRDRDTMEQVRIKIADLEKYIEEKVTL